MFRAISNLTENDRGTVLSCDESVVFQLVVTFQLALITKKCFLHIYCFIFDCDTYDIKMHMKSVYCHKFETNLFAAQTQSRKSGKSVKAHSHGSQWRGIVMFMHSSP